MCKTLISLTLVLAVCLVLTNESHAADVSLVVHYKFDDGSGTTASDSSGNGNDGTLNGNPQWVKGYKGGALEFDGVAAYVEVARPIQDDFTMMAWIKTGTAGAAGTQAYQGTGLLWSDVGGAANDFVVAVLGTKLSFFCGNPDLSVNSNGDIVTSEWVHIAVVRDISSQTMSIYIDGLFDNSINHSNTGSLNAQAVLAIGANIIDNRYYAGLIDEVQIYSRALPQEEIQKAMKGAYGSAFDPSPQDEITDVPRDSLLSWVPGENISKHHLYLGESIEDVNSATMPTAADLDVNSFDPGRLEFGKTYFWRVDEVNSTPDKTVFKGDIWSFTAEPYSIQIPGSSIAVIASSVSNEFATPDKTIDGSGLGADDTHNISSENMWFTAAVDLDPWIQYEFDDVKQLDTMKVWNSNSAAETAIGWGVKDVEIAYSVDGENWDVLEGATQFSRAPGSPTYNQYDEIAFNGVAAKVVRLNIASNWGGILMSYGLSEVQFNMIPGQARTPVPESGSVDVLPNSVAAWRAGRAAGQHTIYLSTDPNAVADGLAPSVSSSTNRLDLSSLDLQLGETYYWRVDEVNEAEAVSVWTGPVWGFTTADALVVDDFESYNNLSPDRPFQAWLDGFGYSSDEFFPTTYPGNGTGAGIGHDIWSLSSPYYDGDIMETSNTLPGSGQSMPFYYTNSGGTASETQHTFAVPQDWTVGGAKILSIPFRGQAGNTGTLYVKINGVKVTYPRDASNLALGGWLAFNIDLTSMNVQNVTNMAIGVDGSSASGMLLIDDITLHNAAGEIITPEDPGTDGLVASYSFEGNANDVSGNGNNGTVNGGAQFVTGHDGSALDCDGVDDYVSTDKTASDLGIGGNGPRTISSWVFTRSFADGGIYDVGARVAGQDFSLRTLATENTWRIQYWGGDFDFTLDTANKWVHFTHIHDGVSTKIYANGVRLVDWAKTIDTPDTNPFQIGLYGWPGNYFDGLIDEVRVYNRALSESEALWLAGGTAPIDKPF